MWAFLRQGQKCKVMTISSLEIASYFDARADIWDSLQLQSVGELSDFIGRLHVLKGERVLDVACGTGIITGLLAEASGAKVTAIDIAPKMIEKAREKYAGRDDVEFICADFLEFAGEQRNFDYVVIFNAYPHFLDPMALSAALATVLAPGGRFAILHSHSRAWLTDHHNKVAPGISRVLGPVDQESRYFTKDFTILAAEESAEHYLIIGARN